MSIGLARGISGVCCNTLRNWRRTGGVPEYRPPGNNCRLFKASDLDKLLKMTERSAGKRNRNPDSHFTSGPASP
ncbi:MAG: MerR family transcriptional regulator [Planctomycetes bacterium]|nr:MerR family transcriptional regulator [Planctomycetota bacterium]